MYIIQFYRDIVNFTYFDKRKLYLGVLLQQLKLPENASKFGSNMHLSCIKGDARKPIIIFKPNLKTPYLVRLYPTVRVSLYLLYTCFDLTFY